MKMGKSSRRPTRNYVGNETVNTSKEEKHIGVTIKDNLSSEKCNGMSKDFTCMLELGKYN